MNIAVFYVLKGLETPLRSSFFQYFSQRDQNKSQKTKVEQERSDYWIGSKETINKVFSVTLQRTL